MATHEKRIENLEKKVEKLERWQIKIAVYGSIAYVVISAVVIWLVTWSLNRLAERLIGG